MIKQRARKERSKILAVVLIFILTVLIGILARELASAFSLLEIREVYAKAVVSETSGFDLNSSALIFGEVKPGGSASREIFFENKYDKSVRVRIYSTGNINELLSGFDNNFILRRNETKKVGFSVYASENAEQGLYTGKVFIEVRRHWFLGNAE